jgi:micrococcal nuclease
VGLIRSGLAAALLAIPFAALGAGCGAAGEYAAPCRLARVVDGDTLDADCAGERVRVRLLRIDTPERGEPGHEAATAALREVLGTGPLELEFEVPGLPVADDYGRLLAYVRVRGGLANVEMVRRGWSPFWTRYGEGRLAAAFRRAEQEARAARRGIWREGTIPPEVRAPGARGLRSGCRERAACCRVCGRGAACGDTCIDAARSCREPAGCACDAAGVCPE